MNLTAYKEAASTMAPGQIVVRLYERAVQLLEQAADDIDNERWGPKGEKIGKALDILTELEASLNMEAGGEVARNLRGVYDFCTRHLYAANTHKDAQRVRQVVRILSELLEAWKAIV
jgi:flagellar protein FliS